MTTDPQLFERLNTALVEIRLIARLLHPHIVLVFDPYPYLSEYDPLLAPLRGTERFREIVERARVGWEEFRRRPT